MPQAVAWIRTRDASLVAALGDLERLSLGVLAQGLPGGLAAGHCLFEALRRGRIEALGREALRRIVRSTGEARWRALDSRRTAIPQAFWRDGGALSDDLEEGVTAGRPGTAERWHGLTLDDTACRLHWPAPAAILGDGPLPLGEALARLAAEPEDRPGWLLTHPRVGASGLLASGTVARVPFERPLRVEPATNSAVSEDGRIAWSAILLALTEPAPPPVPPAARRSVGRPREWDWEGAIAWLAGAVADTPDGLPEKQAEAERLVAGYFEYRSGGQSPAVSAIRAHVAPIYARRRRRTPSARR